MQLYCEEVTEPYFEPLQTTGKEKNPIKSAMREAYVNCTWSEKWDKGCK